MNQWIAIVIVLGLFAIGDVISSATGARVSSVFVTLIGFLALFMSGILPGDIMTISGLQGAAAIAGQGLVFHMGTNINIRQLLRELWHWLSSPWWLRWYRYSQWFRWLAGMLP